jgi:hypothetical protein
MGDTLLPSAREYRAEYGLTRERAAKLSPTALIMHPGPMIRGVEIDSEVTRDPRSVVLDQVANGVPVRMAVLFSALGPGRFDTESTGRATSSESVPTRPAVTAEPRDDQKESIN